MLLEQVIMKEKEMVSNSNSSGMEQVNLADESQFEDEDEFFDEDFDEIPNKEIPKRLIN